MIFGYKTEINNFDPYNVLLSIATNIPVLLMTAFVGSHMQINQNIAHAFSTILNGFFTDLKIYFSPILISQSLRKIQLQAAFC